MESDLTVLKEYQIKHVEIFKNTITEIQTNNSIDKISVV